MFKYSMHANIVPVHVFLLYSSQLNLMFTFIQLQHMVAEMDRRPGACGSDILKSINILDTIYWIHQSWNEVEASTIQKCFAKVGFTSASDKEVINEAEVEHSGDDEEDDDDDDIPLAVLKLSKELFGCSFRELENIDSELNTCDINKDWTQSANILMEDVVETSADEEDEEQANQDIQTISIPMAYSHLIELKQLAEKRGNLKLLESVMCSTDELNEMACTSMKQKNMEDFFVKL